MRKVGETSEAENHENLPTQLLTTPLLCFKRPRELFDCPKNRGESQSSTTESLAQKPQTKIANDGF